MVQAPEFADRVIPRSRRPQGNANAGYVLVHRMNSAPTTQLSMLIENKKQGQLQPCDRLLFTFDGGRVFHVTAESFNLAEGSAVVSMGTEETGKIVSCPTQVISPGGLVFSRP